MGNGYAGSFRHRDVPPVGGVMRVMQAVILWFENRMHPILYI